jgi:hypothetical protein
MIKLHSSRRAFLQTSALASTYALVNPVMGVQNPRELFTDLFKPTPDWQSGSIKAGFAELDISPEIGMEQPGGYWKSYHERFHDPCKVRAMVVDDGNNRVAVVGIDTLTIPRQLVESVRKEIETKCGIPAQAILIGASHSHSAGPLGWVFPGEFDHENELLRTLAYDKSPVIDMKYYKMVEKQLVDVVCQANQSRAEASLGVGSGFEDKVAFNRRFRMKNGLTFTHPGQLNPDIVDVAGPVDPEVGVIGAWDKDGKCIGCVVNYACHATCDPGGISANWIYFMEQAIRGAMGNDCVVVFLPGACGDVTQVDNRNPYVNRTGLEWTRFVGARIGAEAAKALLSMPRGNMVPVDFRTEILNFIRRKPDPVRVQKCIEMVKQSPDDIGFTEWIFAKEIVMLDAMIRKEPVVQAEVQVIQVGPAVFVSNPAEFFCQLGLDIKAGSPFKFTFPVELANGITGYVPTPEAFGPDGGGYETRLTAYSNLDIQAGKVLVNTGVELAKQLKPGMVPEFPKAPPFTGEPWDLGSVKPELH